jgi:hypothetical protein
VGSSARGTWGVSGAYPQCPNHPGRWGEPAGTTKKAPRSPSQQTAPENNSSQLRRRGLGLLGLAGGWAAQASCWAFGALAPGGVSGRTRQAAQISCEGIDPIGARKGHCFDDALNAIAPGVIWQCARRAARGLYARLSRAGGWGATEKGNRRAGKGAKEAQGCVEFHQRVDHRSLLALIQVIQPNAGATTS